MYFQHLPLAKHEEAEALLTASFCATNWGHLAHMGETSQGTTGNRPFLEGWGGTTGFWELECTPGGGLHRYNRSCQHSHAIRVLLCLH